MTDVRDHYAAARGSSFAKGLNVLAWILDHEGSRADEIAHGLGLPLSSIYRYLRELRDFDFVTDAEGRYRSGRRWRYRSSAMGERSIPTMAEPYLEQLAESTGETAVLTVRHGLHAVCVRQVESAHQIRLAFELGQLLPLYAGAGQRALLAHAPDEVQQAVLHNALRPYTPDTPTGAELTRLLQRIRSNGYALSRGELYVRSVAVAMPVLSGRYAVASVCVAGPRDRCHRAWLDRTRAELATATQSLAASINESSE